MATQPETGKNRGLRGIRIACLLHSWRIGGLIWRIRIWSWLFRRVYLAETWIRYHLSLLSQLSVFLGLQTGT